MVVHRLRSIGLIALWIGAFGGFSHPTSPTHPTDPSYQTNRAHHFGPGECGPVDPTYIRLSTETGGQPFFLNPSEVAKAFHVVRESSGDHPTILWAAGLLDGGPQEFAIPIDSTIGRVTFSLSVDKAGSDVVIADPQGQWVVAGDPRAEITILNCGRVVTIDRPAAGAWRLKVSGSGRFWMVAHARSDLDIVTAEFVEPGGRPGHEGLFRIHGQPLRGAPATLRTLVGDNAGNPTLALVSEHGDTIQRLRRLQSAETGGASSDDQELFASFELPAQPFRVQVRGTDPTGLPYQRVYRTLFHGETVQVLPARADEDLPAGTTTAVTFAVRNLGPSASFRVVAADGRRFLNRYEPRDLTLQSGETGEITVWLDVAADVPIGTGDDITVNATSLTGPPTTNGTSVHCSVTAAR